MATVRAIGVDVGGTFTDLALWDGERGALAVFKLPSVPHDPALGILEGLRTLSAREGVPPGDLTFVAHGSTVATNALLEGTGARTGLVTTRGFRDLLEIARQKRPHLYDLQADKPPPLVPRFLRREVGERLAWDGTTVQKLSPDDVRDALDALATEDIEALAVCFLYSFVDAAHERLVAAEARARFPQWFVSLSSEVSPEFREYERLSTTVLNAYLGPLVGRYLKDFDDEVGRLGVRHPPYVNQSNGGIISVTAASEQPVRTLLSGPSAGVMGAAWVSAAAGLDSIITFDMGGTSTDVARVEDGRPVVGAQRTIAGYPVRIPSLEIETVGAGGGSIAWVDSGGALRVGPQSAGAHPGPACYGRGGTAPTVTDANVVLGRLSSTQLLDGRMDVLRELAEKAIAGLAGQLGTSPLETARGVLSVVQTNMLGAIRVVSVRKGYDPRGYTLVAFGGAGPLHAAALARDLGIRRVLVPPAPGILCALGLLVAPLRLDLVRTRVALLDASAADELARGFDELEQQASAWLDHEGVPPARRRLARAFDMRYVGQNFELTVAPASDTTPLDAAALCRAFLKEHERVYGYAAANEPVQIVALRLTAFGDRELPPVPALAHAATADPRDARTGERDVYFEEARSFVTTQVYRRERLRAGHRLEGPAIVEQMDSTTVILPGQEARVDERANLVVSTESA
jgi:N-methylhydantoinase A